MLIHLLDTTLDEGYIHINHYQLNKQYHYDYLSNNIENIMEYENIYINSLYDFMKNILMNTWFKEKYKSNIDIIFQQARGNQYHLFNYILSNQIIPNSKILNIINDYANQFFVNTNLIGVQIRTGLLPDRIEKNSFFYKQKQYHHIQ